MVLAIWFGIGALLFGADALGRILSPRYEVSRLPHFRGVLIARAEQATLLGYLRDLRTEVRAPTFLLSVQAPFWYLAAELENPTPFDYPLVTAFGRHGQEQVIRDIAEGRLRSVCMLRLRNAPLSPRRVEEYVLKQMLPDRRLPFCRMYHVQPPGE